MADDSPSSEHADQIRYQLRYRREPDQEVGLPAQGDPVERSERPFWDQSLRDQDLRRILALFGEGRSRHRKGRSGRASQRAQMGGGLGWEARRLRQKEVDGTSW